MSFLEFFYKIPMQDSCISYKTNKHIIKTIKLSRVIDKNVLCLQIWFKNMHANYNNKKAKFL